MLLLDAYNTHHTPHKLPPVRGGEQPQEILGCEYHHTGGVQAEEGDFVLRPGSASHVTLTGAQAAKTGRYAENLTEGGGPRRVAAPRQSGEVC